MAIRATPLDDQPRLFEHYKLRVWVRYLNANQRLHAKRMRLVAEMGMSEEEYGNLPEEDRVRIWGRSFIGTVVTDIEPCEIDDVDDDGNVTTVNFTFNGTSSVEDCETMGEELLAYDSILRDAILERAVDIEHYRESREVRALGNSKAPSASGG